MNLTEDTQEARAQAARQALLAEILERQKASSAAADEDFARLRAMVVSNEAIDQA